MDVSVIGSNNKVDREQQTPQDANPPTTTAMMAMGLKFADESSSVIQAGMSPPDDGCSSMSASDLRVSSPTKACQESQLSMTPPSSAMLSPAKKPKYLYGRPMINLPVGETSSSCNSANIRTTTNLPLPIHSDDLTTTDQDSEDGSLPPPPAAPHHAHYSHHSHFQQDVSLPHYKYDQQEKLATIYSGPPTTSENNTESESGSEDGGLIPESSSSECGECCEGHAPYPNRLMGAVSPNIIPSSMCKATQISPTTVIEMYAASVRRNNTNGSNGTLSRSKPHPNGFHVPCPVAPVQSTTSPPKTSSRSFVVHKSCPQHGTSSINKATVVTLNNIGAASNINSVTIATQNGGTNPPPPPPRMSTIKVNGDAVDEIVRVDAMACNNQHKRVKILSTSSFDKSVDSTKSKMDEDKDEDKDDDGEEEESSKANSKDEPVLRKLGKRIRLRRKKKDKQKTENRAKKALRTISFILGAFVTCWTPYHIIAIVASFCPSCINIHLYMVSYFLCYLNSPVNPFCYAAANQQFKNAFKRIMTGDLSLK